MGFLDKLKEITRPYDDDEDFLDEMEDEEYEPEQVSESHERQATVTAQEKRTNPFSSSHGVGHEQPQRQTQSRVSSYQNLRSQARDNRVVNINATAQVQVVLVKPERFEAAAEIADHLREKRTVVMNLEQTGKEVSRRLIDFLSGVAYAQDGKIKKVAVSTYIITPYNVNLMGDLIDELENNGMYF